YLAISGYEVVQACDGEEALQKAAERRPDVVLMDMSLPGFDGRETTRRLKARPETAGVPVMILSGMPGEILRGAGADAYLAKPCEPDALLAAIEKLLRATPQPPA